MFQGMFPRKTVRRERNCIRRETIHMARQSTLVKHALEVISQYNMRLTVRQIYYRLVSAGIIKNSRSSYNTLDSVLTKARLNGKVPFNAIEDRSRQFLSGDKEYCETPEAFMKWRIEALKDSSWQYDVPFWLDQPEYIEVWIEKDALSSLFLQACGKYRVRLFPCKGYSSITFLHDAANHLRNIGKPTTILYFGDFDMRGKDIERYITQRLKDFDVAANVQRIALTREQVNAYSLPPQPAKRSDTLASQWIETEGDVAWELDALEPNVLLSLVEQAILKHLDKACLEKRNTLLRRNRDEIEALVQSFLDSTQKTT
jgi:hypothetical protein